MDRHCRRTAAARLQQTARIPPHGAGSRRGLRRSGPQLRDRRAGIRLSQGRATGREKRGERSEEHTSELQSLLRISYAVFCLHTEKPQYLKRKDYAVYYLTQESNKTIDNR